MFSMFSNFYYENVSNQPETLFSDIMHQRHCYNGFSTFSIIVKLCFIGHCTQKVFHRPVKFYQMCLTLYLALKALH